MTHLRHLGIFDSGIGGLTVVRELLRRSPETSFTYLGDTARVPYGNKSTDTIRLFAQQDVAFLVERGVTDVIIACNTVSAHALESLRARFPMLRFYEVISPAVRLALRHPSPIGVIGTRATILANIYATRIHEENPLAIVYSVSCPLFVPLVEEGWIRHPETKRIARRYLAPLKQKQIRTLMMGCTHYPLLSSVIRASLPKRTVLIDTPSALWDEIMVKDPSLLQPLQGIVKQEYYFTDLSPQTREMTQRWLGHPVMCHLAELK